MFLQKISIIIVVLLLSINLTANDAEKVTIYDNCEIEFSECIQSCDNGDDTSEECYQNCDIHLSICEEIEKSK